eukprot:gene23688-30720_t
MHMHILHIPSGHPISIELQFSETESFFFVPQELQLEREKNDIKFMVLKSEINHWEVKNSTVSSIGDEGDNASEAKGGKGKSNRADQPEDVEMVDCMCSGLSFFGQGGRAKYFT